MVRPDVPHAAAYYHVTPLHYVPHLLATGTLYARAQIAARNLPLQARPTAARRERKLHLDGYVHLSFDARTPLLTDKRRRGYPHALLPFDAATAELPGAVFLRYNPKSWRHRDDFVPVQGMQEVAEFLSQRAAGAYPSAELLVPDCLPLDTLCHEILFATDAERDWVRGLTSVFPIATPCALETDASRFPPTAPFAWEPFDTYAAQCAARGALLPPPNLPFD